MNERLKSWPDWEKILAMDAKRELVFKLVTVNGMFDLNILRAVPFDRSSNVYLNKL